MTRKTRHIVALGGGGFSMEPDNLLLDDFALQLTRAKSPRACFLPTASGDSAEYIANFYSAFRWPRARASHLALFTRTAEHPRDRLLDQDLIYVGGGNTANMLAIWRVHGIDEILREAWRRGIVLVGISAGMLCWFECGVTDSFGPLVELQDGLGFLPGSACPHYNHESRRPAYHEIVKGGLLSGYAADDGAALHFVDLGLKECVSSSPQALAYRVELRGGRVRETKLPTRYLRAAAARPTRAKRAGST